MTPEQKIRELKAGYPNKTYRNLFILSQPKTKYWAEVLELSETKLKYTRKPDLDILKEVTKIVKKGIKFQEALIILDYSRFDFFKKTTLEQRQELVKLCGI